MLAAWRIEQVLRCNQYAGGPKAVDLIKLQHCKRAPLRRPRARRRGDATTIGQLQADARAGWVAAIPVEGRFEGHVHADRLFGADLSE